MNHIKDTFKRVLMPINKEGYNAILIVFVMAFLFSMASTPMGWIGFFLVLLTVYFFRDPVRIPPEGNNIIVAPADGVVDFVGFADPPKELGLKGKKKYMRVSTFLSVFNVHVQRVPISGKVTKLHYRKGKFENVSIDKYSKNNERQSCVIETKHGLVIPVVQIAGLIARRIVCNLKKDQKVKTGDRYGMIKFGSRVDIYLPEGIKPKVKIGQTMVGGETVIAEITGAKAKAKKTASKKVTKKKTTTKKKK